MIIFEEILKEKSRVSIKTNEGEYYFNFSNCETNFNGITGGFHFTKETFKYSNFIYLLNKYVKGFWGNLSLMKIETFWSCLNDIDVFDVPEKKPKRFYRFLF